MIPDPIPSPETRRASVLIVDDEDQQCRLLSFLLRRDFEVTTALNGETALNMARRGKFDVALVDYRMPGMTGIEVLRDLKQLQPSCVRMLMTAHALPSILEEGQTIAGIYRFLSKPVDAAVLRIDILRALEHQRDSGRGERTAPESPRVGDFAQCVARELSGALSALQRAQRALSPAPSKSDGDDGLGAAVRTLSSLVESLGLVGPRGASTTPQSIADASKGVARAWAQGRTRASDPTLDLQIESDLPPLSLPPGALERMILVIARSSIGEKDSRSAGVVLRARKLDAKHIAIELWRDGERPALAKPPTSYSAPHGFDPDLPLDFNVVRWIIEAAGGRVTRTVSDNETHLTAVLVGHP